MGRGEDKVIIRLPISTHVPKCTDGVQVMVWLELGVGVQ